MKRSYISLWLLLLVAFGVVAGVSCLDEIKIGGHTFKTATFRNELTYRDPVVAAPATIFDPDTVKAVSTPEPRFPVPVDTAAKTILFFGDSMLEGLSPRLAAYCEASGHRLYTVIWYSSTTQVWGDCDTLSVFIRRYKPDYIIACLGANELFVKDIATKRRKPFDNIKSQIGDRPVLWIGPPNWKPDTGINDFISSSLDEGEFFLSDGMTFRRKSDGAHPTPSSAAEWMDSVVRWMPEHCAHPIRLDTPTKAKGRPARVTLLQPL